MPEYVNAMQFTRTCLRCGAMVHPPAIERHNEWHARLEAQLKEIEYFEEEALPQ